MVTTLPSAISSRFHYNPLVRMDNNPDSLLIFKILLFNINLNQKEKILVNSTVLGKSQTHTILYCNKNFFFISRMFFEDKSLAVGEKQSKIH